MGIFVEFLAQILFEGAFEVSTHKRVPLWLRWILMILLAGSAFLLGGVLVFGAIFSGSSTQIVAKISIGVIGLLIVGGGILLTVKFLRSLRND